MSNIQEFRRLYEILRKIKTDVIETKNLLYYGFNKDYVEDINFLIERVFSDYNEEYRRYRKEKFRRAYEKYFSRSSNISYYNKIDLMLELKKLIPEAENYLIKRLTSLRIEYLKKLPREILIFISKEMHNLKNYRRDVEDLEKTYKKIIEKIDLDLKRDNAEKKIYDYYSTYEDQIKSTEERFLEIKDIIAKIDSVSDFINYFPELEIVRNSINQILDRNLEPKRKLDSIKITLENLSKCFRDYENFENILNLYGIEYTKDKSRDTVSEEIKTDINQIWQPIILQKKFPISDQKLDELIENVEKNYTNEWGYLFEAATQLVAGFRMLHRDPNDPILSSVATLEKILDEYEKIFPTKKKFDIPEDEIYLEPIRQAVIKIKTLHKIKKMKSGQ